MRESTSRCLLPQVDLDDAPSLAAVVVDLERDPLGIRAVREQAGASLPLAVVVLDLDFVDGLLFVHADSFELARSVVESAWT